MYNVTVETCIDDGRLRVFSDKYQRYEGFNSRAYVPEGGGATLKKGGGEGSEVGAGHW